jgi:hypothetical protein
MTFDIKTGRINPIWDMSEIECLEYFHEPFNDESTVQRWQEIYKRDFSIGMQADYRSRQPACQSRVLDLIIQQGHNLGLAGFSWYRMMPGDLIPQHSDTYVNYCRFHGTTQDRAVRALVLLQDWQPGFLLEVAGQSFSHYPAGTFVIWHANCPHMAGNLSCVPRYTLQITATIQ